ncbi:GNAT family N-acetyltransferase [Glycomyces algeriensis]|uniref:N-acetyltransferase domain-containing protein n=1 Tax=Glycomyces algeriensis TaxID=256037 RepID=A0A9W6GCQ4_9ACTN|nr:GNAT family N-acetyltransferase [Glycomyces algeriensis]MDA1368303.1 GNAT family N-acetyltransferase [Glycomyces algeriensis]MDR7351744.1 GNAT superfamily N-acetyltransferase [Glycomyces algeriensis]GLI44470.1 hypothetical protein GALLR39Z86_43200 [Glycomyces algeriensis]
MDIPEVIEISLARPDEYPAVAEFRWEEEVKGDAVPSVTQEAFTKDFAEWALRNADTHRCILVRRNGIIIGMAWLAVVARVPSPGNMSRAGGDLQAVFMSEQARGGGYGRRLMTAVVDEARRLHLKKITVQATTTSKEFYLRTGFVDAPKILQYKVKANL